MSTNRRFSCWREVFVCCALLVSIHSHSDPAAAAAAATVSFNTSVITRPASSARHDSEVAVAFARDNLKNIYVAGQSTFPNRTSRICLYKTDRNRSLLWTAYDDVVAATNGIDVVTNKTAKSVSAYVIVSRTHPKTRQEQGSLIKIANVQGPTPPTKFQTIYTALSLTGHTQILAFTSYTDPKRGSLNFYLTGTTTGLLFGGRTQNVTTGLQQAFVACLDSNGKVLAGIQFNSNGRSESGVAISMNQDSNQILVTVNSATVDGRSSRALLYRLDPVNLARLSSPVGVADYGGNSYVSAQGSANVIPSQNLDIFCHCHVQVGNHLQSVAVYVDGYNDTNLSDYGVSVAAGTDGNAYVIGYSVYPISFGGAQAPVIVVISPLGAVLLRSKQDVVIGQREQIAQISVVDNTDGGAEILYAGQITTQNGDGSSTTSATIGRLLISAGSVPTEDVVNVVGSLSSPTPISTSTPKPARSGGTVIAIAAAGICGLVALVAVVVFSAVYVSTRRQSQHSIPSLMSPTSRKEGIRAPAHLERQEDT